MRFVGPCAWTTRSPASSERTSLLSKLTHARSRPSQACRSAHSCRRCPPELQTSSRSTPSRSLLTGPPRHEVARGLVARGREGAGRRSDDAVLAERDVGRDRPVAELGLETEVRHHEEGVDADRDDVGLTDGHLDRCRQGLCLPPGGGLVREGHACEQRSRRAPDAADVRAGLGGVAVVADRQELCRGRRDDLGTELVGERPVARPAVLDREVDLDRRGGDERARARRRRERPGDRSERGVPSDAATSVVIATL